MNNNLKKYTWLLFDADGTLFNYDQAEIQAFTNTIEQIGVEYDERYLNEYKRINSALWLDRELGKINLESLKIKRFELLFKAIGVNYDPKMGSDRYLRNLGEEAGLIEDAFETVKALASDYKLALVTNGIKEVQRRRLEKSPFQPYIETVIISDEIGASKPDVKFFEITFEKIGNPLKSETLIIGDSQTSDMQGATNYGIDACWYNPRGQERAAGLDITYEISRLPELVNILSPANP